MRARAARRAGLDALAASEARRAGWLALGASRLEVAEITLDERVSPTAEALAAHRAKRRDGVDLVQVGRDAASAAYWRRMGMS